MIYAQNYLCPKLAKDRVVIMDNLNSHQKEIAGSIPVLGLFLKAFIRQFKPQILSTLKFPSLGATVYTQARTKN